MLRDAPHSNVPPDYTAKYAAESNAMLKPEWHGVAYLPREWDYSMAMYNVGCDPDDIVLDVGCGCSYFIFYIADCVKKVYGIDNATFGCYAKWRKTLKSFNDYNCGKVEVVEGNASVLPFEDESFDKIFSFSALEHFIDDDDTKCVKECFRVLKPGGIFCGTVDYNPLKEWPIEGNTVCRVYTLKSFYARLLEPTGFEMYDKEYLEPIPEVVNYIATTLFFMFKKGM